jgi:putative transposase
VKRLCELVEVSTSGFYASRDRPASPRAIADGELLEEIRAIHLASRCTYGAPRVRGQLRRRGHQLGCKRVARLTRQDGLMGVHKRKWRRRRPDIAPAPDRLNRDFSAARPNQRWVATSSSSPPGKASCMSPASATSATAASLEAIRAGIAAATPLRRQLPR